MRSHQSDISIQQHANTLILHITICGTLQHCDYQNINNVLDASANSCDINVSFDMTKMRGFTLHAVWDDLLLGIKHWSHFKKIAIIGDKPWQASMAYLANHIGHIHCQLFSNQTDANAWLNS